MLCVCAGWTRDRCACDEDTMGADPDACAGMQPAACVHVRSMLPVYCVCGYVYVCVYYICVHVCIYAYFS